MKNVLLWFVVILIGVAAVFVNPPVSCKYITVTVDVTAETNLNVLVYYAVEANAPYKDSVTRVAKHGTSHLEFHVPDESIRKLRMDFGAYPGRVEIKNLKLNGAESLDLNWGDFRPNGQISSFDLIDQGVGVVICSNHKNPYAVYAKPIYVTAERTLNLFCFGCRVFLVLVFVAAAACLRRVKMITLSKDDMVLILILLLISGIRISLSSSLPPMFHASAWDDTWFAKAGGSMIAGHWLGSYDHHTLCKGFFGPMVLAFCRWLGFQFLSFSTFLHMLACFVFSLMLFVMVRNRWLAVFCLVFLLFEPLSFSAQNFQKLYRNGMAIWQVPVLFVSFIQCYRLRNGPLNKLVLWLILSGMLLWMFFNTREDGVWFIPFVSVCLLLSVIGSFGGKRWSAKAGIAMLYALPLVICLIGNSIVGCINKQVYGVYLLNDRDAGNYARAMRDLYLIKPDFEDEERLSREECKDHYHNVYYSTVRKAYRASPTLARAQTEINRAIESWAVANKLPCGEPAVDHILFALRNGAYAAGRYNDLRTSEQFWGDVHKELVGAFADGRLEKRGVALTAMTAPFQVKFLPVFIEEYVHALWLAIKCSRVSVIYDRGKFPERYRPLYVRMSGEDDTYESRRQDLAPFVNRAMNVAELYEEVMPWLFFLALSLYLAWTVYLMAKRTLEDLWLLATGIVGSLLIHSACIAYVSASTFPASHCGYMCPSYLCVMMFIAVVFGGCLRTLNVGIEVEGSGNEK